MQTLRVEMKAIVSEHNEVVIYFIKFYKKKPIRNH